MVASVPTTTIIIAISFKYKFIFILLTPPQELHKCFLNIQGIPERWRDKGSKSETEMGEGK